MAIDTKPRPNLDALQPAPTLLRDWSLEITAKDADGLTSFAPMIPQGTKIWVSFVPSENMADRARAAAVVRRLGFIPVPHLPARRFGSTAALTSFLDMLTSEAAVDSAFVIAGDAAATGVYDDALAVIRSGLLSRYGIKNVGVAGYPEGHPSIADEHLWSALVDKQAALAEAGHDVSIVTQFGFDAAPVLEWLGRLRDGGVTAPVRVGLAGPTSTKTLLRFAARCGVRASAGVMAKYGLSITRLFGSTGPDQVADALTRQFDDSTHGDAALHFFPFGGVGATAEWVQDYIRATQL